MGIFLHTLSIIKGSILNLPDRFHVGTNVTANAAGGGAGQAVSTVVTPGGILPPTFSVTVDPGQDATWYTTSHTTTTFTVVLTPRLAANTLAAGTFAWQLMG